MRSYYPEIVFKFLWPYLPQFECPGISTRCYTKSGLILDFFSLAGLSQLDAAASGRMGSRALLYYFSTTIFAAIVGIACVLIIHPGDPSIKEKIGEGAENTQVSTIDAFLDLIR